MITNIAKQKAIKISLIVMLLLLPFASCPEIYGATIDDFKTKPTALSRSVPARIDPQQAAKTLANDLRSSWYMSLNPLHSNVWVTQNATLTATSSQDVGPTSYYISIFDETAHAYVALCATGASCAATVTQTSATDHSYRAYISKYPTNMAQPPSTSDDIKTMSSQAWVIWTDGDASIDVIDSTNLPVGGSTTVTATSSTDVGPTPFWIQLFDATTGTRLVRCGTGKSCSVTVKQTTATTHSYVAYVSQLSSTMPPAGTLSASVPHFITWSNEYFNAALSWQPVSSSQIELTATTYKDVGPTPYYISIYNENTSTRLTTCSYGTICKVYANVVNGENDYVAFVSNNTTSFPPETVKSSSNVISYRKY
ncbi:MAG TPA: hypothetical protein VMR45_05360 [Patescibacteria group bacterium]|nr:hypothetical protein [Patescibacteria group bacterium]